jgi:hypothetical protein
MSAMTSAELEREAEISRARVEETAQRLRQKMTPGQILDEVTAHLNGGDVSKTLDNFRAQARDNPMALALVGTGLAWLWFGNGRRYASDSMSGDGRPGYGHAIRERGARASAAASNLMGDAAAATGKVSDTVTGAVRSTSRTVGAAASSVADGLHYAADESAHYARSVAGSGRELGRRVGSLMDQEPLVFAALGVAAGAALGASLPTTRLEEEKLGGMSAGLKEKIADKADRVLDDMAEVGSRAAAAVVETAESEGLTPGELSAKAGRVASAAVDAAKDDPARARNGGSKPSAY